MKWYTVFASKEHHILFSLVAFDTGKEQSDLYHTIPKDTFQTKDLETFLSINSKFTIVSKNNPYRIKDWNNICVLGHKSNPYYSLVINGEQLFSVKEFPEIEFSNGDLHIFQRPTEKKVESTFGKFSDFNFGDEI